MSIKKAHNRFTKQMRFSTAIACVFVFMPVAYSAPTGGEITAGSGNIQTPNAQTTVVNQNSSSLSINWESLNLAADELLQFKQPGREAVALNYILDQNATSILGQIDANGRVFLMNPNGMIFGESARINVGSLVAGAFQMDSNFLNKNNILPEYLLNIGDGEVINNGFITALNEGSVALVGNQVVNNGSIVATLGKVHLLSASEAALSFDADGMIQFSISKEALQNPDGADAAIDNSGNIQADGGYVVLEGQAANGVYANVVNNSGVIHAGRISNEGGVIRLEGMGGIVANTGELSATGGEGSTGGNISLYGDRVGVFDGSNIDASGEQGGGNIYIGGQRKGAGEHTAEFTQVSRNTSVKADAVDAGDGGEIIVWADDTTWAYGDISATGGEQSGNGGFIEISGKQGLVVDADIDLSAPNGQAGTILFDPINITIHDAADGVQGDDGDLPDLSNATRGTVASFDIGEAALEALAANATVILEATNDITLNNLADNILTLATDATGSVTFTADSDSDKAGDFVMLGASDTITTDGSDITISGNTVTLGLLNTDGAAADGNISVSSEASTSIFAADAATGTISLTTNSDASANADSLSIFSTLKGATITLTGGNTGSEQLIGTNQTSTWTVDGANSGTYFSTGFSGAADFGGYTNLVGGNADDSFTVGAAGTLSGLIDGGTEAAEDVVDYSAATLGAFTLTLESDVTDIERLIGGPSAYILQADDVVNNWSITASNDGIVGTVNFVDFSSLTGGTAVDTFTLNGGSISGTIAGGTGSDILIGNTGTNTWNITGADDAGNVTSVFAFTSIENLTGNSGADTFTFGDTFSLSGAIDGAGGSDSVDKTAETTGPVNVILGGTGLNGYSNIESFASNAAVVSNITGENINTSWAITGDGDGTIVGTVTSTFTDFDNLTGGTADDDFTFSVSGEISGIVDGGGAGADNDTLTANNETNIWAITGPDAGTVTGGGTGLYSATFTDIENLTGNAQIDTFNFSDPGTISGIIDGSTASDVVNLTAKTAAVVVNLATTNYTSIENFLGNGAFSNELQVATGSNTWNITGIDTGNIGGTINFTDFNTLTGNTSDDTFILGTGGEITGTIAGGSGTDILRSSTNGATWHIDGSNNGFVNNAADAANLVTDFSGIDTLQGDAVSGTDVFKFEDPITTFFGLIDGGGDLTDEVDFSLVTAAIAVDLSDTAAYNNIESYIGGQANSTITGKATANTWGISGTDSGTYQSAGDSYSIAFADFDDLIGSTLKDTFTVSATGNISGSIDGAGATDDTLVGNDIASAWVVTAADTGTVTDANGVNTYSGIEILTGGSAKDDYDFQYIGTYPITDGGGAVNDTATFSSAGTVVANLGPTGLSNIEFLIGNNTDSTVVVASAGDNDWTIDSGTNNGSVILDTGGLADTVNFDNFTALTGGAGSDDFQFQNGASTPATGIAGLIDGGAGTNSVTFAAVNAGVVDVELDDTNNYTNIGTFTGSTNIGVVSTLTGEDTTNTWNITGADAGDIDTNSINFVDFQNMTGGTGADNFVLNGGTVSGIVDGGTGSDTVTGDNAVNAWGIITTAAGVVTNGTLTGITGNFTNIENLTGNADDDTFTFSNGTSFTGTIDGGGETTKDTVTHAAQLGAVNITLGAGGYNNIEDFVGSTTNSANSTLTGDITGNSWVVDGGNSGTVDTIISFSQFGNLQGDAGDDTFSVTDAGSLSGATGVDGGAGTDILLGGVSAHTWNITGVESGDIDGVTSFSAVETLTGNLGVDDFVFSGAGSFTGLIDGGASNDTVDFSSLLVDTVVSIDAASTTSIEDYIGNSATNNSTLQGRGIADNWIVSGANTGTVNGITFSFFNRLDGDGGADIFTLQPAGRITGYIDGGLGSDSITASNNANVWNVTALDTGDVTGGGLTTNFQDVENLIGNDSGDTFNITANLSGSASGGVNSGISGDDIFNLTSGVTVGGGIDGGTGASDSDTVNGPNAAITWAISGVNSGVVDGNTFSDIENLAGGTGVDTFNITNSATAGISGSMSGGAGNDIFTVDYNGSSTRTIIFDGGTGTDSLTLTGSSPGVPFNNSYIFGPLVDEVEVTTTDGSVTQVVDVAGIDSVTDTITADNITLTGSAGNDTLTLSDGLAPSTDTRFVIGGSLPVDFGNKTNLSISGGAGVDTLTIDDVHSYAGDITLAVETLTQGVAGDLGADNLTLNGVDTVGAAGVGNSLVTNVNNLQVNGPTTDVYVNEANALSFDVTSVTGVLDIELLAGDIVATNDITTSAASTFTVANGNSITLSGTNNQFTGSVAFNASAGTVNNVTFANNNAVDLQATTLSGDLTVTAAGDITQSGVLTVGTNSSFSAGANAITLNNAANNFSGDVILQNTGANDVAITDQNALSFGSSSIGSGALTVIAGSIAQTGPIIQQASAGATSFTANAGTLTLDDAANDFTGTVSLINSSGSNTTIVESDHLILDSSTISGGNLTVTAVNGVTITGTTTTSNGNIDITATTGDILLGKLDAGSGGITLNANAGNVFGDLSPVEDPNLTGQDLVIITSQKTGEYDNPIAVSVPSNGTGFFTAGINDPQIIGFEGVLSPGSQAIYDDSFLITATNKRENFTFLPVFTSETDGFYFLPLHIYADGGLQIPDYTQAVADASLHVPGEAIDDDDDDNINSGIQIPNYAKNEGNEDLLIPEYTEDIAFDINALPSTAAGDDSSGENNDRRLPLLIPE